MDDDDAPTMVGTTREKMTNEMLMSERRRDSADADVDDRERARVDADANELQRAAGEERGVRLAQGEEERGEYEDRHDEHDDVARTNPGVIPAFRALL